MENLLLQAVSLGLVCHPEFGIPAERTPMAMLAVGHPFAAADRPAPRSREPLDTMVSFGRFGVTG